MHDPAFNLFVLFTPNIDRAVACYTVIGLTFTKHRHGAGPEHYAAEQNGMVFEIYPMPATPASEQRGRFGFRVSGLDALVEKLVNEGVHCIHPPRSSPWGRRAVLKDMDGYFLELVERENGSDAYGRDRIA